MEEEGCIYYIFCKETGKGYVGLTKYPTPDKRYKRHWWAGKKDISFLHSAMKKYGHAAFTVERLWKGPHEALPRMEEYFAEQLETYKWDSPGGYNMVWCGSKGTFGIKPSLESRQKMSEARKKQIISLETRYKLSKAAKGRILSPETCQKMSKPKSPETRQKMSEAAKIREEAKKLQRKLLEENVQSL